MSMATPMKRVAALAACAAFFVPTSAALAHRANHRHARSHCTTTHNRRHSKRHITRRCRATHRVIARFALVRSGEFVSRTRRRTVAPTPPPTPATCDLVASPVGSDASGNGSVGSPFASVNKLDASLTPGQTGCLRQGTYGSTGTQTNLTNNGNASAPITITAYPGETPTVKGLILIPAAYTTVSHLSIDGSNTFYDHQRSGTNCPYPVSEALAISGPNDTLEYNDYYQSIPSLRGNGIGIGFSGNADNTTIRFNKIHDVGQCWAYDHIIYLSHGNNVQIYGNWMWNDPHGWGVQLYPAPTNARVHDNVIDHAGSGFIIGNEAGNNVSGNQIWHNVVTDSTGLAKAGLTGVAISDYWGGTPGTGNTFTNNDSYRNPGGIASVSNVQLTNNITTDPQFIDPTNHNYNTQPTSPTTTWNLWNGA
jgi:hypothetical protein